MTGVRNRPKPYAEQLQSRKQVAEVRCRRAGVAQHLLPYTQICAGSTGSQATCTHLHPCTSSDIHTTPTTALMSVPPVLCPRPTALAHAVLH